MTGILCQIGATRRAPSPVAAFAAAGCLLLAAAAPLRGQDSVLVVPDAITCNTCSLDTSAVVELGDREGPGIVGPPNMPGARHRIALSDDGDYYVTGYPGEGRLLRFSPDGVFQGAIGRLGEGPGEYHMPVLLGGGGDSLTILDVTRPRLTTIRGDEVATSTLGFRFDDHALLPDGRHVYNAVLHGPDQNGHPLHLYDPASGRITHSIGDEGIRLDPARRGDASYARAWGSMRVRVAAAADGNIWAARANRYRIDKWSPNGDRLGRIERDAPWFRPWEVWPGVDFEVRPLPVIVGVQDWGDGLLMVVVRLADENWRPIPPTLIMQGHEMIPHSQEDELYDTVIEILDTRSGTVLARTRVDANVLGLVEGDGFYSYAEHSELGEPKYVVWSVALSGRDGN